MGVGGFGKGMFVKIKCENVLCHGRSISHHVFRLDLFLSSVSGVA